MNTGDTAWLLMSAALVMFMTPGLALFYGGMVRRKNILGTIVQSLVLIGLVSVEWALVGYSMAFGPDLGGIIGDLSWFGLSGVGLAPYKDYAATVPHQAFMVYQMMFAVITPALITGAFAERMKFLRLPRLQLLWALLVYNPVAHWVWGIGRVDPEHGRSSTSPEARSSTSPPASRRWRRRSSWGNARASVGQHAAAQSSHDGDRRRRSSGSDGSASTPAAPSRRGSSPTSAFVATHLAAASATLSWMFTEWIHRRKPTVLGAASGCVAGLVAITPASGFVTPLSAIVIGLAAGAACYGAVMMKGRLGYDDALDVVGVHCVGGTLGALATGLFATTAVNAAGANGLFFGNAKLLAIQALAVAAVLVYSFVVTYGLLKVLDKVMGLRLSREDEMMGLDLSEHGEAGYNW